MQLSARLSRPAYCWWPRSTNVAQRGHVLARVVVEPDPPPGFQIDHGDLLAGTQVVDGLGPFVGRHPVGDAAAIAAAVEAEHQSRLFRRAAVHEGIDAQRPVRPDKTGLAALKDVKSRTPHQRTIGENPEIARPVPLVGIHGGCSYQQARAGATCGARALVFGRSFADKALRLNPNAAFGRCLTDLWLHIIPRAGPPGVTFPCCCWLSRCSAAGAGFGTPRPRRRSGRWKAFAGARPRPAAFLPAVPRISEVIRFVSSGHAPPPRRCSKSNQPPVEVKARGVAVAAKFYEPTLLVAEFQGPLTVAWPGQSAASRRQLEVGAEQRARYAGGAGAHIDCAR